MRDIAITLIVFGLIPYILMRPQIGIYAWSWIGYMNPHKLAFGFAFNFPYAQIIAIATLISILFWKQPKRIPINAVTIPWFLLIAWMLLTTIFSLYPGESWEQFEKVAKIQLVTFLTILVIKTRKDLEILIWVIALSIGFYGIKGGIFTIQTLGASRVWGPPGGYIEDNNALSVATLMILPLFYYLQSQLKNNWIRLGLLVAMVLLVVSAMGAQSRSGLVAALATGIFLWWKTQSKFQTGVAILVVAIGVLMFMPDTWYDRMGTIITYQEDGSAMGRIAAWKMAINLANDRLMGGGFNMWGPSVFQMYSSNPDDWGRTVAAHSIYFTMVGEHGWPALALFLSVYLAGWRYASKIIRLTRDHDHLKWVHDLSRLLQVSLVAYASGGAFLNLAYFDLPWHILAIIVILREVTNNELQESTAVIKERNSSSRNHLEQSASL